MNRISSIAVAAALVVGAACACVAQVVAVPGVQPPSNAQVLSGTVTDPSGAPAADMEVSILPPLNATRSFRTDGQGRYSLDWRPLQVNVARSRGAQAGSAPGITYYVMARDQSRNLVATAEIDTSTTDKNLQLQPGLTLTGNVQDSDGKTVPGTLLQLTIFTGNIGASFNRQPLRVEANGAFTIPALPRAMRYAMNVRADGYGTASSQLSAAETDTDTLRLPTFTLPLPTFVVAGRVLDADDKPISGAQVQCNGVGQPNSTTRTDSRGHFELKVCDGRVQLVAFIPNGTGQTATSVQAQAGDTSVVIRARTNLEAAIVNGVRAVFNGSPMTLRNDRPKPPRMTWEYFKLWPSTHKKAVYSVAACQLLVLAAVVGGVFWITRRGRA